MEKIIPFAHRLLKETIQARDIAVDATCGNGNDTLMLANACGKEGHVYAFDIQKQAIQTTKKLLQKNNSQHVTYIQDSHAKVDQYIPLHHKGKLAGAIFNLGYLPRSDKSIITKPTSTIEAIEKILPLLKIHGRVIIVVYHGHDGGNEEKQAVVTFTKTLDQTYFEVIQYQFTNQQNNPPFVIGIEKMKQEELQ